MRLRELLRAGSHPQFLSLALLAVWLAGLGAGLAHAQGATPDPLTDKAFRHGAVRVIVRLARPFVPEPHLATTAHVQVQRRALADARAAVRSALAGLRFRVLREPATLPFMTIEVDADALRALRALPGLADAIVEDRVWRAHLAQSGPTVQAPSAWAAGYDGSGMVIAILDTGVAAAHPFLAGKVVREACFSSTDVFGFPPTTSVCPAGAAFSDAPGSGAPCATPDCIHGTHVAGIAAGGTGASGSGIAKGAKIWAIQVFSRVDDLSECFPDSSCVITFSSDFMAALDYLFANGLSLPGLTLAAANLSLGAFADGTTTCDDDPVKLAIDQLRAAGVATVAASGNEGFNDAMGPPACISSAVSVGSTGDSASTAGLVSSFSNVAPFLSLFAPGEPITSSVPPSGFATFVGTSLAAPHVAGAIAILRQAVPDLTVDETVNVLRATGVPVTDDRAFACFGGAVTCPRTTAPRIRIVEALAALGALTPDLAITVLTVPTPVAGGQTVAVRNTVKNLSPAVAVGPFEVGFYLSTDATIDPATDTLLATRSVSGLPASGISAAITTVKIPDGLAPGLYFIGAVADPTNAIEESNETNNARASGTLTIVQPDVATTAATAPTTAAPGAVITVANTVRNNTTAPIGAFTVGFYLSSNAVLDGGDMLLAARNVAGLAAGAVSTASTPVTIPANTPPGTYRILVRADDAQAYTESDEANNILATALILVGPDLIVTAVTARAKAQPGQTISLSGTVQNVGSALLPAQTSTLAFYLSTDNVLGPGDVFLGSRVVPGLGAGATSAGATTVTIPGDTPVGPYFVIARADDTTLILEAREENNTRATVAPMVVGPDIAVTVATGPAGAAPGLPVSIANTVVNHGPLPASFTVAFYLSANDTLENGVDVPLGSRTVTALAAGGSSAATSVLTIPSNTAPGSYRVLVRADDGEALTETIETNNLKATGPITIALPNLEVTALTAPATAAPGATISTSHTVRNAGPAPGAAPASVSRFYLSIDAVLDGSDVPLGVANVPALGPGLAATVAKMVTIPADTSVGAYFILVRTDDGNLITEIDDIHNTRATATPILVGPDLIVTAVTARAKAQPGQTISLSGTVQNVGSALLPAQTSTLAFYLSTDNVLGPGDVFLGSRVVPGLGAGATSAGATTVTIPGDTPVGSYFVIARADDTTLILEAREENNTRATVAPMVVGPDIAVTVATGPAGAAPGLPVSIANTVVNHGPLPASFTVAFYLSANDTFENGVDVPLGSRTVTALAAGGSSAATSVLTIPSNIAPGSYRVLVRADDGEALTETIETNNLKATGPITIALPNLEVTALSLPLVVVAGRSVAIGNTVRNNALAPGAAHAFTLSLYLSADGIIDPASDPLLASRVLTGLAHGASSAAVTVATLPNTPGDFFVGAVADPGNAVSESDETNNTLTAAVAIVPEMRRNAAGSVNATANISLSGCLDPVNNDSFSAPAVLKITTQTGANWSGTVQFTSPTSGAGFAAALSGAVQTSGVTTGTFTLGVTTGAMGSGALSGTATSSAGGNPGTLNATLTGSLTTGELCAVSATLSQP